MTNDLNIVIKDNLLNKTKSAIPDKLFSDSELSNNVLFCLVLVALLLRDLFDGSRSS